MNEGFVHNVAFWLAGMALMMMPMTLPTFLLLWRISGRYHPNAAWGFACAHAGIWSGFSFGLAGIQTGLRVMGWPPPATVVLLLTAVLYQFSSWKLACLHRCRSLVGQVLALPRPDWGGGFRLGWDHGLHCLGCCWLLMLTMLGTGMMAPAAMLVIALLLAGEHLGKIVIRPQQL